MEYKIEDGIDLPRAARGRGSKSHLREALEKMSVGQSIFVPVGEGHNYASHQSVAGVSHRLMGRGSFATRREDGGVRVWRVK